MKTLHIKLLNETATAPTRATQGSVGYDLYACLTAPVTIEPGETMLIGSGFAMAATEGYAAFIYARSGHAIKHGIAPANCVGVIDSDYRGEVKIGLRNSGTQPFTIAHGERIAQMVIAQCALPELVCCESLDDTARGAGGFGSTN